MWNTWFNKPIVFLLRTNVNVTETPLYAVRARPPTPNWCLNVEAQPTSVLTSTIARRVAIMAPWLISFALSCLYLKSNLMIIMIALSVRKRIKCSECGSNVHCNQALIDWIDFYMIIDHSNWVWLEYIVNVISDKFILSIYLYLSLWLVFSFIVVLVS